MIELHIKGEAGVKNQYKIGGIDAVDGVVCDTLSKVLLQRAIWFLSGASDKGAVCRVINYNCSNGISRLQR